MKINVQIGYKFIIGFIFVVFTAAFSPRIVQMIDIAEWLKEPLGFLMAILIGLILGSILSRSLTKDFRQLARIADDISNGDLTRPNGIDMDGKIVQDETTELAISLNAMLKNLKGLVHHIKDASRNLSNAALSFHAVVEKGHKTAEDISKGTSRIFEGALEQAGHVDNASKIAAEVANFADDVSHKVTDMAAVASQTRSAVQRGVATSTSALKKMESILQGVDFTKEMIAGLEQKINNIPRILDVITHISRQTDILALNATIEASKAGEHGRGFAIVAEEVRRFSENTNRSVDDAALIIKDVKGEFERLVKSASESAAFTHEGREDISRIKAALDEITAFTSEVAEKTELILSLAQNQKEGVKAAVKLTDEIANIARESVSATEDVDRVVESHRAYMEDVISSAKKLSELSRELDRVVARFKIGEEDISIFSQKEPEDTMMAEKIV